MGDRDSVSHHTQDSEEKLPATHQKRKKVSYINYDTVYKAVAVSQFKAILLHVEVQVHLKKNILLSVTIMTNRISVLIDISYILVKFDFLPYLFMHTYNLYIHS